MLRKRSADAGPAVAAPSRPETPPLCAKCNKTNVGGPVINATVPADHIIPVCPHCRGPRRHDERDRLCSDCRRGVGLMAEVIQARDVMAGGSDKPLPPESFGRLRRFSDWSKIADLSCQVFGHPAFTDATWRRLVGRLSRLPEVF